MTAANKVKPMVQLPKSRTTSTLQTMTAKNQTQSLAHDVPSLSTDPMNSTKSRTPKFITKKKPQESSANIFYKNSFASNQASSNQTKSQSIYLSSMKAINFERKNESLTLGSKEQSQSTKQRKHSFQRTKTASFGSHNN